MVARARHLSVEPSFRTKSSADSKDSYIATAHFSFSIVEPLRGTPAGDVVVVEYSVRGGVSTKAQAIEEAKKWIASRHDEWWNEREAIIFLDDLRFMWGKSRISELSTSAQYSFADHFSCIDHSCYTWGISTNDSYGSWVWLPSVWQGVPPEVPDSDLMFRVVVEPYGADNYGIGIASQADIKAILETYWSESYARSVYFDRHHLLWEAKGSDSYSFVYSGVDEEDHPLFAPQRVIVRNGEAVEAFHTEDFEAGGVVYPAGTRIEANNTPTLENTFWYYAEMWGSGTASAITDVTFDYEFGYPSAFTFDFAEEGKWFFYASDYTPLND